MMRLPKQRRTRDSGSFSSTAGLAASSASGSCTGRLGLTPAIGQHLLAIATRSADLDAAGLGGLRLREDEAEHSIVEVRLARVGVVGRGQAQATAETARSMFTDQVVPLLALLLSLDLAADREYTL